MSSVFFSLLSIDTSSRSGFPGGILAMVLALGLFFALRPVSIQAQIGGHQKISDAAGNFGGTLNNEDRFGKGIVRLGDLDDDGISDLAVGAFQDGDGGNNRGAVWILFLNSDGTVASHQKISDTAGAFGGSLDDGDFFGVSVARIGDLDGNNVSELAVGAPGENNQEGAVWILFMNGDGTVADQQKISSSVGGFSGTLEDGDKFGEAVSRLGKLDNDKAPDLAVGSHRDDDGGTDRGAAWILFLNSDGTVASHQKISDTAGNLGGELNDSDLFGQATARIGDLDEDGNADLAVGAGKDDDGGGSSSDRGAVWILFLNSDGTVASHQKISDTAGSFGGGLDDNDRFGGTTARIGDLNGDTVSDLAVGAINDDDGGSNRGAVWILYLDSDGTVLDQQKISDTEGGFAGSLSDGDEFGTDVALLPDLDGDDVSDLAVGSDFDDDGGTDRGAVWVLFGEQALLPVELASFSARHEEETVRLRWQTASETNNAGFRVERKGENGREGDWTKVGSVEGSGTTSEPQRYRFTDAALPYAAERLVYRLKQVDTDGSASYSEPITVERGAVQSLRLKKTAPNPATERVTVRYAVPEGTRAESVQMRLYDVLGRRVQTVEAEAEPGRHARRLDVSGLSSGVYFLRLQAGEVTKTRRLTVVR